MARRSLSDPDINRLYQIPLADFVAARNALAKHAGAEAAGIRALQKPSLPAWAVNRLFWQKRAIYEALVERAADLRATHAAALRGRPADVRGASRGHEEAVDRALKATLTLLAEAGSPATDATRQAIATTLRGLPSEEEAPGRLTRPLQPRGFDTLTGAAPPKGQVRVAAPPSNRTIDAAQTRETGAATGEARRMAAARGLADAAAREAREAEQLVRREEFDAARLSRQADRAARRVQEAEEAVQLAEAALAEARRAADMASTAREAARARVAKARTRLAAARQRTQAGRA